MQSLELLTEGNYFHIYNHGIDDQDLFRGTDDYNYFLHLYEKYIDPVAETFAWVLMKNHFHLLIRIKENMVYKYSNADRSNDAVRFEEIKWETINLNNLSASEEPDSIMKNKKPQPHLHFSHLFNAYTKYINKQYQRHGNLFERPFKRKQINSQSYLKQIVIYIHNNPVHHNFCQHPVEYPWSSYLSCISVKSTKLQRDSVIGWFDDVGNFKYCHEGKIEIEQIEKFLNINQATCQRPKDLTALEKNKI